MRFRRLTSTLLALVMIFGIAAGAFAYQEGTLYSGVRSEEVKKLQTALIQLGYLGGTPDGIYGTHTELAVKKFQKQNGLKADGVAGAATQEKIYQKAGVSVPASSSQASSSSSGSATASAQTSAQASSSQSSAASGSAASASGLFGGNYSTLRQGYSGARVKTLQQRLIALGYLSGSADGKFGKMTKQAVVAFQKAAGLSADGLAGKKTLQALEKAGTGTQKAAEQSTASGSTASGSTSTASQSSQASSSSGADPSSSTRASGPSGSQVRLLHWFNDVKPALRSGQTLYIYEPSSGLGWNLRIYSCGRHCDAEPLTAQDTANMLQAFGGKNTWDQKAVYVKLPSGIWTLGSTHDMPHMSGSVKDNNFNGHLCVHFLRTMSEARQNDPSYGVSNQNTIRAFWKSLTGEVISD